jgi:guanylate kinase
MNNTLYLFIGKSASGKTTVANFLEKKHGLKQVNSYTTRPPRYEGEIGHIFVNDTEFDNLGELVAYTEYNGFRYGTTAEQLDQCQIYVVDIPGLKTLLERYKTDRKIVILYFNTTICTRINRMIDRGDSDMSIISRLLQDEKEDWSDELNDVVWHNSTYYNNLVYFFDMYADDDLSCVVTRAERYMGCGCDDCN